MKKKLLLILQTLFGLLLLVIFLKTNDLSKVPFQLSKISFALLFLVSFVHLTSTFLKIVRFKILLEPLKKITLMDAVTTSLAGAFLNYLIPVRAGEVGKAWYIKKKYNLSLISGTTASFVDKFFDVLAVILLLAIVAPLVQQYSVFHVVSIFQIGLLFLIFVSFYFLVYKDKVILNFLHKIFFFLSSASFNKIVSLYEKVVSGFSILKVNPIKLFSLIFLSAFALFLDGLYFYLVFLLFGFTVSFFLVLLGYSIFNFSFILPAGPGYIGHIELLSVLIFSQFLGIPSSQVVPVVISHHIILTVILFIAGFASISILQFSNKKEVSYATE